MYRVFLILSLFLVVADITFGQAGAEVGKNKRAAISPPIVKIVESDSRHLKAVISSKWSGTLADDLGDVSGETVAQIIRRATAGLDLGSYTFEIPALGKPGLLRGSSSFEEVSLGYLPQETLEVLAEVLPSSPVSIVGVGILQHQPVASLDARMLTFDPSRALLRRYDRIDAEIRLDGIQSDELAKAQAAQANPNLLVTRSALAEGTWFKFPVEREGVYRIDIDYLVSLGVSPQAVDPARVRVFGNGGRPLPALNADPRPVDLVEQPVYASYDNDTIFEDGEFILFFANGIQNWYYDPALDDWAHVTHPFSNSNYFFLQTDGPPGARIRTDSWPAFSDPVAAADYEDRYLVDDDLIHLEQDGSGSGLEWFGALVDTEVKRRPILDFTPLAIASGTVRYRSRVAVRSNPAATIQFESNGSVIASATPGVVNRQ